MKNKFIGCIFMFLFTCGKVSADSSLSILLGARDLNQSEDILPVQGFYFRPAIAYFLFQPELSLLYAYDPVYEGSEYDVGFGGVHIWRYDKIKSFIGMGAAIFSSDYGVNHSNGFSIYGHGGISRFLFDIFALGLDVRLASELTSKSNSNNVDNGYFQYAITVEFFW